MSATAATSFFIVMAAAGRGAAPFEGLGRSSCPSVAVPGAEQQVDERTEDVAVVRPVVDAQFGSSQEDPSLLEPNLGSSQWDLRLGYRV
ncbi:hypothetical protein SAY87_000782 [Trapa incisa]|uniref:Secreted protein n=1 Tax=Trapa incisa TaxID=236973 RepID=A0AAN7GCK7_9MYRT|nr:hypothetical protein SAY87_000782 [Trapa incisa]